ncbi:alpha/beta hydrolase [Phenylobacterium sp. LjRoot219]|uniref:alpha/beta hydrolase n=1 Tax=Phenylobacterium sp. LjRoot219 TaxID=3342283 RepID=UPI003ECC2CEE
MSSAKSEGTARVLTVHRYYQAILDRYAEAARPYFHQVSAPAAREMLRAGSAAAPPPRDLPELDSVTDATVAGPGGPIPIRRYRPTGPVAGLCVYLHAGGWIMGDLDFADATCRRLAAGTGCEVVSVDYRLAPEHPFPAALDDAWAVLEWAATQGPGPLLLVGESAGGNIAAACALRARDAGGPPIAGQFLAYPVTDHGLDTASHREVGGRNWLLSTADMRCFWDHYCPPGVNRDDPLVSPLRLADAAGLPPTLVFVAELDPLRDEGLAYAARLAAAGVPVDTRTDAGMLHGYLGAAEVVPIAAEALAQATAWLRSRIKDGEG